MSRRYRTLFTQFEKNLLSEAAAAMPSVWPETDHPALGRLRDGTEVEKQLAIIRLFRAYESPVKQHLRSEWAGLIEEDLEDLASRFYEDCLVGLDAHFLTYDPQKPTATGRPARLRTYLCRIIENMVHDHFRKIYAMKRGGKTPRESLDTVNPLSHQEQDTEWNRAEHDLRFDRHWARGIQQKAYKRFYASFTTPTQLASLQALKPWIVLGFGDESQKTLAKELGCSHNALRSRLTRLRHQWQKVLRSEIAQTVGSIEEVEDEFHHLCSVLARFPHLPVEDKVE